MLAINKNKACYGYEETTQKVNESAIKKLIVSENLLKTMKEEDRYKEIDGLLKTAENMQAEIEFITGKDTMKKLDALGGIAGILRW